MQRFAETKRCEELYLLCAGGFARKFLPSHSNSDMHVLLTWRDLMATIATSSLALSLHLVFCAPPILSPCCFVSSRKPLQSAASCPNCLKMLSMASACFSGVQLKIFALSVLSRWIRKSDASLVDFPAGSSSSYPHLSSHSLHIHCFARVAGSMRFRQALKELTCNVITGSFGEFYYLRLVLSLTGFD